MPHEADGGPEAVSSRIAQVADALVTLIQAQTWATANKWSVEWDWDFERDPSEFDKASWISVLPTSRNFERLSRSELDRAMGYSIAFQKRHNGKPGVLAPKVAISSVDGDAEALAELLAVTKLSCSGFQVWASEFGAPEMVNSVKLSTLRLVTFVVDVTYKVVV